MAYRTTARVFSIVLPSSESLSGPSLDDYQRYLRRYHHEAPWIMRTGLKLAVVILLYSTPLTIRRFRSALHLTEADQQRHLDALCSHRIYHLRMLMVLLKTVAGMAWGADPQIRIQLQMPPYGLDPGTWRQP